MEGDRNSMKSCYAGNARMTPSNATKAIAFAGNARRKQGTKPLSTLSTHSPSTQLAASLHLGNFLPLPSGSVMIRCLTTSDG
jgi:hypothetical protein